MRPLLLPALRRLWRDSSTLQLGLDPARAVVISGLSTATVAVLQLLDGRHTLDDLDTKARALGIPPGALHELLRRLAGRGVLVDGAPAAQLPPELPVPARRRLRSDLEALSFTVGAAAGEVLAQRARRQIVVHVGGRLGPVIAASLAAAGIGRIHLRGSGPVRAGDIAVGGLLPSDEHDAYLIAAEAAVRRAAPEVDTRPIAAQRRPDLIVLADRHAWAPPPAAQHRAPVLPVAVRDGTAIIGPLLAPGRTACERCLELHRRDRDPDWPVLAAQLATSRDDLLEPCQSAVATAAAGLAAMQALSFLDGGEPYALGRSLELRSADEGLRSRTWQRHPHCPCAGTLGLGRPGEGRPSPSGPLVTPIP